MSHIKKAIFPLGGGMGTRLLPATKVLPKEIIPIINKPLVQYAVEEAIESGITELIFITGQNKRIIEDHFDRSIELERYLVDNQKLDLLNIISNIIPSNVHCTFIRQPGPLGLGHAVLSAEHLIKKERFAVILSDDLIDADIPTTKQLIECSNELGPNIIAVQNISFEETEKYGIVTTKKNNLLSNAEEIINIIEKPSPKDSPSQTAIVGRYIFNEDIFKYLKRTKPGINNEIQLTDAIFKLLAEKKVFAFRYNGLRFDCGNKYGIFSANIHFGKKYHGLIPV